MLSVEQRQYIDTFRYRGGMVNIGFVSGYARHVNSRGGYIQQTRNENHMLPFTVDKGDSVPGWVRDKEIVKVVGRIIGVKLPGSGQRVCVLRALRFEVPSILELPPEAAWEHSPPPGAPRSEFVPKIGHNGLPFTKRSNDISIAGFCSGVLLERAGTVTEDGVRGNAALLILIQQTRNADEAIPVRMYGKFTEANESRIKLGTPLLIKDAEFRIDVKRTGEIDEHGIEKVTRIAYIKTIGPSIANKDHIRHQPDWAVKLAHEGRKKPATVAADGGATSVTNLPIAAPKLVGGATNAEEQDDAAMSDDQVAELLQVVAGRPKVGT